MDNRKIAFVDLTEKRVTIKDIPQEWREKYLGGRGINSFLLYSLARPPYDPYSPENPLIIGAGPIGGMPGFGTGRLNISALSPSCGNIGDSNIGGHFAAQLRFAGFDHIVVTGKSATPVYVLVENDTVQIRDAERLWGKDTWETQQAIRAENKDERVQALTIGIAGENLVRMASVITGPKDAAGRFGMGAVMGSKKLKAIAARGTKDLPVAHARELLDYYKEQLDLLLTRGWIKALKRQGTPLLLAPAMAGGWMVTRNAQGEPLGKDAVNFWDKISEYSQGMASCYGCPVHCRHRYHIKDGKFAGTRDEGPEYGCVLFFGVNTETLDMESVLRANYLCNRLGLDAQDAGTAIGFALELYERGIIGKDLTGRPLEWGDPELVLSLIEDMAHRRGFGDIMAEGPQALKKLPPEAARHIQMVKGAFVLPVAWPVRKSYALHTAVATLAGHQHRGLPGVDVIGLPREVMEKVYGGPVSSDFKSYEGKGRMIWWHELCYAICDSMECCRFQTAMNSLNMPKFEEFSRLLKLELDLDMPVEKLKEVAERILTVERLSLGQLGVGTREHDVLSEKCYAMEVKVGPGKGEVLDPQKFDAAVSEYYSLHGWDENGVPTPELVKRLGITKAEPARVK